MPKSPIVALLLAMIAAGVVAQSPSYNCAKATTNQENAICMTPELRKADAEMAAAYQAWLAAAPSAWKIAIRQNQRLWLRQRDGSCKPKDNDLPECLKNQEDRRIEALRGMVAQLNGVKFVWQPLTRTAPDSAETAKDMRKIGLPAYGFITAAWPQAQSSTPEWQAWNKAIAAEVRTTTSQEDAHKKIDLAQAPIIDSDTDVAVSLTSVSDDLVSATIASYWYGHGAAHPLSGNRQFNWLLKEKRPLKAADVFNPGIHWSRYLYERVNKYLHEKLDSDGQSYENFAQPGEMKKTVQAFAADPQRWQIDAKGITIPFEPYEVGCYACTPEPFSANWESLKPLLNPSFVIPKEN